MWAHGQALRMDDRQTTAPSLHPRCLFFIVVILCLCASLYYCCLTL